MSSRNFRDPKMVLQVLMVAEKPALARSLAAILANGHYESRTTQPGGLPVLEYDGTFQGQKVTLLVCWRSGFKLCNMLIQPHPAKANSTHDCNTCTCFGSGQAHFKFTAVRGHVLEVQFPPQYNNWFVMHNSSKEQTLRMPASFALPFPGR